MLLLGNPLGESQTRLDAVMWHTRVDKFICFLYGSFCAEKCSEFHGGLYKYLKENGIIQKL